MFRCLAFISISQAQISEDGNLELVRRRIKAGLCTVKDLRTEKAWQKPGLLPEGPKEAKY